MAADFIAIVETHWRAQEHKNKRITLNSLSGRHLCASSHGSGAKQKGVALIMSREARLHKVGEEPARDETGCELGTALRVELALGPRNKRAEVVLMGDLNTDVWSDGRRRPQLMTRLRSSGYKDAWRTLHGDKPGLTFPIWEPKSRLDYIFVTAGLAHNIRQVSRVTTRSDLNEDHCQVWMEMGGQVQARGPSARPPETTPRIASRAASAAQWKRFTEDVEMAVI
ncbi:hypothetical protein GGF44_005931, partial [Coemansia sp. RSA 1694]